MRVRIPSIGVPATASSELTISEEIWHKRYQITTITPIYGGGVNTGDVDTEMPIRASAIRGQLRFWWRLLVSNIKENPLKGKALYEAERALWGGMAENKEDCASKVWIRVTNVKMSAVTTADNYLDDGQKYALFPARDTDAKLIKPGLAADLHVTCQKCGKQEVKAIENSLRWWISFGGIGARTRRGLGSILVNEVDPVSVDEVKKYGCMLVQYPKTVKEPILAWNNAIAVLQCFRQGKLVGRKEGSDPTKPKKLGRSNWPEPDSIREIIDKYPDRHRPVHKARRSFPRAAFGLPIIFEIRGSDEPRTSELKPLNYDRMASPLILKAMAIGVEEYQSISLCLPTNHLDELEIELVFKTDEGETQRRRMGRSGEDIWWPLIENEQQEKASNIKPMENRGHNALTAFLNYFSKVSE